jgi:cytochrome c oxidase subunit 2
VKQDAVPGWVGNVWFDCDHMTDPGDDHKYAFENPPMTPDDDEVIEVACAELCGLGHFKMRMEMKVLPREKYDEWVRLESANALKIKSNK